MSNSLRLYEQVIAMAFDMGCAASLIGKGAARYTDASTNVTWRLASNFLPAYFIHNCSTPDAIPQAMNHDWSARGLNYKSMLDSTNGDNFIAVLFVVSGLCVSSWMLFLLLCLSPRHKSKPLTTYAATVMYCIASSINLNLLTKVSRDEFHSQELDVMRIHIQLYGKNAFKIPQIFSQLLNHAALFEIAIRVCNPSRQWLYGSAGAVIILVYTITTTYYEIRYNNAISVFVTSQKLLHPGWRLMRVILKLAIILWVAVILIYHTFKATDPRRVSYSRRLLPLALFNWLLLVNHAGLDLSLATVFRRNWLVKSWLEPLPYFFEVVLITTLWEWIFNIALLEKNHELADVLGRRVKGGAGSTMNLPFDEHSKMSDATSSREDESSFQSTSTDGSTSGANQHSGPHVHIHEQVRLQHFDSHEDAETPGTGSSLPAERQPQVHGRVRWPDLESHEDVEMHNLRPRPSVIDMNTEDLETGNIHHDDLFDHSDEENTISKDKSISVVNLVSTSDAQEPQLNE